MPPLQQGEKKLKSYYVRTLEEAIQPDGTFLVYNKPIFILAEEKVLKACLESWFYTRRKTGSEETGFRRSLFAGHVSESKTLHGWYSCFLYKHVAGVEVHDTKTYGLLMKERGIYCSPDGVLDVKLPGCLSKKLVLVEIKTKVAISTINEAVAVQSKYGSFIECNFDSDICKTTVGPHRFQILHNAVTCVSRMCCMWLEVKLALFTYVSSYF